MPSRGEVKDKKEAVDYNKNLVENAEDTLARLRNELETRQHDLEKIKNLEVKIEKENTQMNDKLEKMEDEMQNKFPEVTKMRGNVEADKQDMQQMKKLLAQVQPGLSKQMAYHSMTHDTLKNQILQNDVYKNLDSLEKKMIVNEQQIYALHSFIASKATESNFQGQLAENMNIVHELNMEIVKMTLS